MMGRRRKVVMNVAQQSYKSEESDEDQIEIFDVPVSKMFRRQQSSKDAKTVPKSQHSPKDAKTVPSDTKANEESMLVCAGFDLEGISGQEKFEIMKAVLASKADQVAQNPGVPTDKEVLCSNNTGKSNKDREKLVTSTIQGRRPLNIKQVEKTIGSHPHHAAVDTKYFVVPDSASDHGIAEENDDFKTSFEDIPLKRHYRGVKTLLLHKYNYFRPSNDTNVEDLTKAICHLFELYQIRLQQVQKSCHEKLEWGEAVKSGHHHSKTIDFKRRGQDSIYLDLSNDDDFQNIESSRSSKGEITVNASDHNQDPAGKQMDNYSENELAVAYQIQDGNSWNYGRPLRSRRVKCDTIAAETQKFSFDDACDMKYVSSARSRQNGPSTQNLRNVVQVKADTNNNASRMKLTGVGKTQQDDSYVKEASMSNEDIGPDTQEDEQLVCVNERLGTGTFKYEIHQDKTNTCNVTETTQKKYENHEQKEVSSSLKNDTKYLIDYHPNIVDQITPFEKENNLNKSKNNLINAVRGKKGKAEKQNAANLTEDSADLEKNNSNVVRNTRLKRKCYLIDRYSVGKSAAVTVSPEINLVRSVNKLEKAGKNMAELPSSSYSNSLSSTNSSPLDFRLSTIGKNARIASSQEHPMSYTKLDQEEGLLSQVTKRKRFYNETKEKYDMATEAFDVFKKRATENSKNVEAEVSSFLKTNRKASVKKGVKRLLSKPVSSESTFSDDLSSTSSQVSSEMIDEKGNIYSTQFSEIKLKMGKGKHVQNTKVELETLDKNMRNKHIEGILMLVDSDEDFLVVDSDMKDDCMNTSKKSPSLKNAKSNLTCSTRQNLPNIAENTKAIGENETIIGENETIKIDPKLNEMKIEMPISIKKLSQNEIILNDDEQIWYDDANVTEQNQSQGKSTETKLKQMRTNAISTQNAIKSPKKTTGKYQLHSPIKAGTVQQKNIELEDGIKVIYIIDNIDDSECGQKSCDVELSQDTGEEEKTKRLPFENKDMCEDKTKDVSASVPLMSSPVKVSVNNNPLLNNAGRFHTINIYPENRSSNIYPENRSSTIYPENRSSNKHINILNGLDGNLVDRPKTKLQRRVLDTVSAVEHKREPEITQQKDSDRDDVVPATPEKSLNNKRTGKKNGKNHHLMKKKKMILVACPICNVDFPEDTIEEHAEYCTGPESNHQDEDEGMSSGELHPDQVRPFPGSFQVEHGSEQLMLHTSADFDVDDDTMEKTEGTGSLDSEISWRKIF